MISLNVRLAQTENNIYVTASRHVRQVAYVAFSRLQSITLFWLLWYIVAGGDVKTETKDQVRKTARSGSGVAGGLASVSASTTSKDSMSASRTTTASSGQTRHRFKRKPRILFSQAQVDKPSSLTYHCHHRSSRHSKRKVHQQSNGAVICLPKFWKLFWCYHWDGTRRNDVLLPVERRNAVPTLLPDTTVSS